MASLKDISDALNISTTTVSNAFSGRGRMSPDLKAKILETAEAIGYVPSIHGQALHGKKLNIIALMIASMSDGVSQLIFDGIEQVAAERGYSVLLACSRDDNQRALEAVQNFTRINIAGVLHLPSANLKTKPLLKKLDTAKIPSVTLYRKPEDDPSSSVTVDHARGYSAAIEHVKDLGHSKIGFLYKRHYQGVEVKTARKLIKELDQADGMSAQMIAYKNGAFVEELRAAGITALLCDSDKLAMCAIDDLKQAGLSVPNDISVSGFRDVPMAAHSEPPLTTLQVPFEDLGREGARLLFEQIERAQSPEKAPLESEIKLAPRLIIRASTQKA